MLFASRAIWGNVNVAYCNKIVGYALNYLYTEKGRLVSFVGLQRPQIFIQFCEENNNVFFISAIGGSLDRSIGGSFGMN